jgi:glycosyl hydrolase family 76
MRNPAVTSVTHSHSIPRACLVRQFRVAAITMRLHPWLACAALTLAVAVSTSSAPAAAPRVGDRAAYLAAAEAGARRTNTIWWNPIAHWYTTYPWQPSDGAGGLATLWDVFPVLEARALIARANPTPANRAAVVKVGIGAERYWNPDVEPAGGYAWLPGHRGKKNTFFDDNGWFAMAYFEAYRATGNRRFLRDAIRAFRFIDAAGWARNAGGVWWDTNQQKKTAEPLAAEALVGALLYETTHDTSYLRVAKKYIAWADRHSWNRERRLYQRNEDSDTVMNYVQGMMIGAHAVLCRALHDRSYCRRAEQLARASMIAFPRHYHWATETDAIYLRWILELWAVDRDPRWYALADYRAQQALANARDSRGLFTKRWDGAYASPDRLLTHAGTLMLLASVAAAPTPPR